MRIVSANLNGIRSAATKGFFDWMEGSGADVVCIQETKAQEDQLADPMFRPDGHHCLADMKIIPIAQPDAQARSSIA